MKASKLWKKSSKVTVTEDDDMAGTNKVTSCDLEKYPVAILRDQLNDVGTKPSMNVRS
jgi:hypothetical protein